MYLEPRGLIRLLQFIFAIFAFATACNGGSDLLLSNGSKEQVRVEWSYPYNLQQASITTGLNKSQPYLSKSNSIKPSAEFFVFTGVTSMLITLAFLIIYVLCDRQYRNDERLPMIDFLLTIIWTVFWIAGSSAWGQGVSDLRHQTSTDYVTRIVTGCKSNGTDICSQYECKYKYFMKKTKLHLFFLLAGTYANVTVSVIFGFLNFLLWVASVWFIYKETRFFKSRNAQQQQPPPPPYPNPYPNTFSNISPPVSGTIT